MSLQSPPDLRARLETRAVPFDTLTSEELAAWRELAAADPDLRSPFFSPAYTRAVAHARAGVRVCVLRREGRPVGFLPYQFQGKAQRTLGAAEPIGGEMTDAFGLVAAAGLELSSSELLRAADLHSLLFSHLPASQARIGLHGEQQELGLAIDFPGGGELWWRELRELRKAFVDKTERRERQLEETHGPLEFHFQSADRARDLAELIGMKREQYQRTAVRDVLAEPWRQRLLELLAVSDEPDCTGVLSTLRAGETFVAAHFGLRSGSLLHYWFPVYNPELSRYSPGRLLLKAILCAPREYGLASIDRGVGDTQAKREFANRERIYSSGLWQRPGWRAGAFRAFCSLSWRLARSER
jgi:CelD/BcsL family acetyltransferase involved in cellulose biosynthesis